MGRTAVGIAAARSALGRPAPSGYRATGQPKRSRSVRAHLLEVTWLEFCGTVGALGAHPRADELPAVLGARQHAVSR
jgi:hypothetical protein